LDRCNDAGTLSTALDQLRLARLVGRDETLAAVMATRSYWLPVADRLVLGQRGGNLLTAGLDAAKQLVDRLAPGAATPLGAYRRHIENHIRAGNTTLP
jgi:hypothetical protein